MHIIKTRGEKNQALSRGFSYEYNKQKHLVMSTRKGKTQSARAAEYQYQVHASNISDLQLEINKTRIRPQSINQAPRQQENAYIFKPKSYSMKRNIYQGISQNVFRSNPSKKVKRQNKQVKQIEPKLLYYLQSIIKESQMTPQNYFQNSFFHKNRSQKENNSLTDFQYHERLLEKRLNPMIKNQITIISNQNQKIKTLIHEGLLLANTSHTKVGTNQHFLQNVINPFDFLRRDYYLKALKFENDYKSGYAPIQMQQKNNDQIEEGNNYEPKTHFIRKKQSTLTLPRSCGVSYIKPSESHQKDPFKPLPPLIFQCSSRCQDIIDCKQKYEKLSQLFNQISISSWIPYIQTTQDEMRNLMLGKKVGQIGWVKGIQNLWPLLTQNAFFLLIFSYQDSLTPQQVWKAYGQSPFKIGILTKRSTSGKKAFLKSLNIKESLDQQQNKHQFEQKQQLNKQQITEKHTNSLQSRIIFQENKQKSLQQSIAYQLKGCRTVITLSLRLQMYMQQNQWKSSTRQTKDILNFLINNLKDILQKSSLQIIKKRLNSIKPQHKIIIFSQALKNLRVSSNLQIETNHEPLKKSILVFNRQKLKTFLQYKIKTNSKYIKELKQFTRNISLQQIAKQNKNELIWEKTLKMPLYYISTRDSFAFDLIQKTTFLKRDTGRIYKKIQYYFEPDNLPTNYGRQYKQRFPDLDVGVHSYHGFFTQEELKYFQKNTFETQVNAFKNKFLQMTVQPSIIGTKVRRTKFFFGYRYMWTRCQLAEPGSYVGAGVRKDVTQSPKWTDKIVRQFVKNQIAEKDFINSISINVYHDGKQGLAQHFDDAVRFKQPIFTLRLFSDARLSFGSQFYGFCNGAFVLPLPRGCICVMEENSYAANGVKHCVRPCDMTGKSAAIILRQMHSKVVSEAKKYDELVDFPAWVSCLSSDPAAVTYAQQKRRQSQYILSNNSNNKIQ